MPNQQNPYNAGIDAVLESKGFSNRDTFTVGAGGQSVFNTSKEIGGEVTVFENGVITNKAVNVTGSNEVTTGLMPQGTTVDIIY